MKFGRNLIKNNYVRVTKTTNTDRGGHFVGHLGYQLSGKLVFKLEREFEKSHPCMNLEVIQLKMTKLE